ncbi:MAG: hypothetical protein WAM73_15045 [Desulfobacterales bacterium]
MMLCFLPAAVTVLQRMIYCGREFTRLPKRPHGGGMLTIVNFLTTRNGRTT